MVRIETLLKITTYLCAIAGLAVALPHLDAIYIAGFFALAALALFRDCAVVKLALPRWFLNLTSIVVITPSVFKIGPENVVPPVLEGLVLLLGIKLLEDKKTRDYMQIYLLSMFMLTGSTLITLKVTFLFYFIPLVLISTAGLVLLAFFAHDPNLAVPRLVVPKLVTQALLVCAFALPACAFFFVILPRTAFPLFSFFGKAETARSGFSDSISLGDVTEIQEDSTVVLRAEMPQVADNFLYWRGVELDRFDGSTWQKSARRGLELHDRAPASGVIDQTIYLEPSGNRYLFALDRPVVMTAEGIRHRRRLQTSLWFESIQQRILYRAVSIPSDSSPGDGERLERYLELPPHFSKRISELARELVGQGGDPAYNMLSYLRSQEFQYSLEGLPRSDSPLEEFLFDQKRGNCEYFASALGVMLRSEGIPARLVAGYRGGYYNPAGNYYLVLQKNAHVWVEAYREGRWLRLDPTPVYAQTPGNVYRDSLFIRLRLLLDTFDYYWGKFVISYDLSRQLALWERVRSAVTKPKLDLAGMRESAERALPYAAGTLVALAVLAALFMRLFRKPERVLVSHFLRKMKKRGYKRGPGEGLEEFSSRIVEPDLKEKADEFVCGFHDVFYRDCKFSAEETKRLKSCIRCL